MNSELARAGADLKAVVGFHSALSTTRPQDAADIRGKVLVQIGSEDPIVPLAQRNAFEISDSRWNYDVDRLCTFLKKRVSIVN